MHVLVAKDVEGDRWDRWRFWVREAESLAWSPHYGTNRIEPVVDAALDYVFASKAPPMAFTYSDRWQPIVAANIAERPEELSAIDLGVEIEVYLAEGRFPGDDRWTYLYRDARSRRIYCLGRGAIRGFRYKALRESIRGWFESHGWPSFGTRSPRRADTNRPPYARELYVRHGDAWQARLLRPSDFEPYRDISGRIQPPRTEPKVVASR